jgi:acetyl-CoA carboxylase biotin carboxylase subunit
MLRALLIANRGEIACRIIRTARRMGLTTIAVYSDADAQAAHVAMADKAVHIGPSQPSESYLKQSAILAAAKATGADAVHPGYGFLSENAEFAQACAAARLVFVGPPPDAIRAMGLKDRAKALAAKAGVPVVPGYAGDDQTLARLAREAERTGYPLMIKAVAGGGGKGMRRVDHARDFEAALEGARREAKSAFGDDRVLIEKYVARPRHIEMQVFADRHGNAVHLFERDCSLQRRHQKVIEEAPAPRMPASMREKMGEAAVKVARAVGYVGAGTVEFIADGSSGLAEDRFWFMEMNTRLQVEHPVTEAITGLDLVAWQLRVAAGETLPLKQEELRIEGHAIEARLYAEDPEHGFLPSIGRLERLKLSASVRVDSGVREGDTVSMYYDPMIAKVIAHDASRKGAAEKLAAALSESEIAGVRNNNGFLIRVLTNPDFLAGHVDTGFIDAHPALAATSSVDRVAILSTAAAFILDEQSTPRRGPEPWNAHDGFRLLGTARQKIEFVEEDGRKVIDPLANGGLPATALRLSNGTIAVIWHGETHIARPFDPLTSAEEAGSATDRITAPMPGKVARVLVRAGEHVARGQPLLILEAMKMEHTLAAPGDADVEAVEVAVGHQVQEGNVMIRFKSSESG